MAERQKKYAGSCTTNRYPFTQKIRCACCGKYYRRKTTVTGVVWICSTYNTKGKKYCPTAKQIPENTLLSACCDVLEISEFDAEQFAADADIGYFCTNQKPPKMRNFWKRTSQMIQCTPTKQKECVLHPTPLKFSAPIPSHLSKQT